VVLRARGHRRDRARALRAAAAGEDAGLTGLAPPPDRGSTHGGMHRLNFIDPDTFNAVYSAATDEGSPSPHRSWSHLQY
jgi:hypothetical protein